MFSLSRIIGNIPTGALQPIEILIVGSFSCPGGAGGDPVELRVGPPGGPWSTFSETTSTGGPGMPPVESVTFSIPAQTWADAVCGGKIAFEVRGFCGGTWTNWQSISGVIDCYCPRIGNLQVTYGACSGQPLQQSVTITATVMQPPGPMTYTVDFGDGQYGSYTINNTGDINTPNTLTIPHDFDANSGPYHVCINALECPRVCITVRPNCGSACCPVLTLASPQVTGCEGNTASASFVASLSWPTGCPPIQPAAYIWTLNGPTGQFQKTTSTNTTDTSAGWTKLGVSPPTAGPVDLTQSGSYSVTVLAQIPGVPSSCFPIDTKPFNIPPCCCSSLTGLSANPSSGNTPLTVNFQVSVTCPSSIVPDGQGNLYHWDFGDGTTAHTQTPNTAHTYGNPGTFAATVTVNVPPGCLAAVASRSVTVTQPPSCPQLTGLMANPSSGTAPLTVNFQANVTNPGAIAPDGQGNLYHWDFGDGTTAHTQAPNTSHTYANPGTFAATVTVDVPPGCPAAAASTSVTITRPGGTDGGGGGTGGGGGFNFCAALLIIAIVLLFIGNVLVVLGVCLNVPWLWIAGAIVGVVGLLLLIAWAIWCSATTPCSVMRTVHCILFWIVAVVAPILVIIASIFGGLPCGLATAASWGGWGTLYAWLGFIMRRVGCSPTC